MKNNNSTATNINTTENFNVSVSVDDNFNVLEITTLKSGIKRIICNTEERWIQYDVGLEYSNFDKGCSLDTLCFYQRDHENYTRLKIASVILDFDHSKYYDFIEQEKDQICVYYVPLDMLLE